MIEVKDYIAENHLTLQQLFDKAWEWRYGGHCRSNRTELDRRLLETHPRAVPSYVRDFLNLGRRA